MKNAVKRFKATFIFFLPIIFFTFSINAYSQSNSDAPESLTLPQCIDYALKHQPLLQQSLINVDITRSTNKISLAGWLPQANLSANFTHYLSLPSVVSDSTGGKVIRTGITNTFVPAFTVSQAIFSPTLFYASKSAPLYVRQAEQITDSTKIFLVSVVSKSFYNLLQTLEQIDVLKEDTARLNKNLSDTYHQYVAGTVDETDYDEAGISLNNSKAQLKQQTESIVPQYAMLKQVIGYPSQKQFNVSFDTLQMMNDITFDTTQQLQFEKRIEFQQLQTSKSLQHQVTDYYRSAFLPTVSAVFNYTPEFESNSFPNLFGNVYPYSFIGLSISLPIFTGFARLENIHRSRLQERLLDWDEVNLKSQIYTDYTSALANYKSNLYNYEIMKDNEEKAKRVYGIVQLQYSQGIVAYLNVITAESNLISSEIGYVNALFLLLSSKIDLQKAMGVIKY
ncbi:MAG TPA: TolC family protein [Puia sp.]|jgi:outer membrane protein TolC|nr:TolC family protein [Puia sp.]